MTKHLFLNNQTFIISTLLLSFLLATPIEGAETAHEHGVGALFIAVEGHDVEIELTVPGSDVVGFEHLPSSESEHQEVIAGAKTLRDVNGIVNLSSEAKCQVEDVEVTSGLMEDNKDKHGDAHNHEARDNDDHKEGHSEFVAHYHFHCEDPKKLTSVTLGFFRAFPSAHELKAKWITPGGQGAAALTSKSPSLKF